MLSDGTIEVSNKDGFFTITGPNSSMTSDDINITPSIGLDRTL